MLGSCCVGSGTATPLSERSWTVLAAPDDLELVAWRTVGNVELLWAKPSDFVNDLRAVLDQRGVPGD